MAEYNTNEIVQKDNHYVDNDKFHRALLDYKRARLAAIQEGAEEPAIPEYIGECFLKISTNLARRWNFNRYSYRDDMIGDGYLNCLLYFRNYDPEWAAANQKAKPNPHAYFTLYCMRAFVRRLVKEEKQSYVKYKYALSVGPIDQDLVEADDTPTEQVQTYDNIKEFVAKFEKKMDEKKQKTKEKRRLKMEKKTDDDDIPLGKLEEALLETLEVDDALYGKGEGADVLLDKEEDTLYNDKPKRRKKKAI